MPPEESFTEDLLLETSELLSKDVSRFSPPDQQNFEPITVGLSICAVLLVAYMKGFTDEAKDDAEKMGRKHAKWLKGQIVRIFGPEKHELSDEDRIDQSIEEVRIQVDVIRSGKSDAEQGRDGQPAQAALRYALTAGEWGIDTKQAAEISAQIAAQAERLITAG